VGADNKTYAGSGRSNADYLIEGAEVVAAADGKVLVVVDGVPENQPGTKDDSFVPGNVVAVEHGPGEIAHYCHLAPGSMRVKPGDVVRAGQVIGLVGNSGNSSEPHLHFHVQTAREMSLGVAVEPVFDSVCLFDGKASRPVAHYRLHRGDVVGPCAP